MNISASHLARSGRFIILVNALRKVLLTNRMAELVVLQSQQVIDATWW